MDNTAAKPWAPPIPTPVRVTCAWCGKAFDSSTGLASFCSGTCGDKGRAKEERDEQRRKELWKLQQEIRAAEAHVVKLAEMWAHEVLYPEKGARSHSQGEVDLILALGLLRDRRLSLQAATESAQA